MATPIDELLDRAIAAFNSGEVDRAHTLASEILAADRDNRDATEILAVQPTGELRRLTVMFCDVVGSTEMSERLEPETYRTIVARYQTASRAVIEKRYGGTIMSNKGDGILAAFGFPVAHEDDADRGVRAGLDVLDAVAKVSEDTARMFGEPIAVRIAVHKGVVFLDLDEKDLYGFAVNVAARLEGLAEPGTLLISEDLKRLIGDRFELRSHEPRSVKGVSAPVASYTVIGEGIHTGARANTPIVGRTDELEKLADLWVRAKSGERAPGECATIVGDPGIGKSRLVSAVAELVEKDGGEVVELLGSPLETESGLWPIRRLIERRCGYARDADATVRLVRLRSVATDLGLAEADVALLATLLGLPPEAGFDVVESDARRLRDEIDEAILSFLAASFHGGPGLLVFEDAHWFDEQTRALVGLAGRRLPQAVLLVVTSRVAEGLPRGSNVTFVGLSALPREAARELLRQIGAGVSRPVLDDIVERSDGVPLYLEELLRARTSASEPAPSGGAPRGSVPEVLYEPLMARLNISPDASAVAAAAAAVGAAADRELLGVASQLSPREVTEAIEALVVARILVRADVDGDDFRFRHELLREAAYELQPPTKRRSLHGRIADALVATARNADTINWSRVADHYSIAGRLQEAVDAFEQAATHARLRGGLVEAKALLSTAIDLLEDVAEAVPEDRVRLRLGRAYLAFSLEGIQSAEAAADYEYCLQELIERPPGDELIAALLGLSSYYMARAEFDRTDELLAAIREHRASLPAVVNALIAGADGLTGFYRGDARRAAAAFAEQKVLLEDLGGEIDISKIWFVPLDPMVLAKTSDIWPRIMSGDFAEAMPLIQEARRLAETLPFPRGPFTLCGFLGFESWFHLEGGDFVTALQVVDEMADLAARYGFDTWGVMAATEREVFSGLELLLQDNAADRQQQFSNLAAVVGNYMNVFKAIDQYLFMPFYLTTQALFHEAAGEIEQAITAIAEAHEVAARTGQHNYEPETIRHGARLKSDPAERAAGYREAYERAVAQGLLLYQLNAAVDVALLTGKTAELDETLPHFDGRADFPQLVFAREIVSRAPKA